MVGIQLRRCAHGATVAFAFNEDKKISDAASEKNKDAASLLL
jgi:hypothetical protein